MSYPRQIREATLTHLLDKNAIDYNYHGDELNFRCPLCGDSQRDPNKMRGWYNFEKDMYWCFNCQEPSNFEQLALLFTNATSMQEFIVNFLNNNVHLISECALTSGKAKKQKQKSEKVTYNNFLLNSCVLISDVVVVPMYVTQWISDRKLKQINYPFYYCKDKHVRFFDRVIIPFFDRYGDCVYFQARTMHNDPEKYINPIGEKNVLFGENAVNFELDIPVLEGPIKSLFVENAIATMSCSISSSQSEHINKLGIKDQLIIMFDNDEAGMNASIKYAKQGFRVFIYPDNWPLYIDADEYCIKKGIDKLSLKFILQHTYNDVSAIVQLKTKLH